MRYRKEIDGLRAISVLAVIFFHAGFQIFKGGYVGVDIFFVISGYLITSLIINEINQKKFSLINFYERRIRRIFPALFILIIITIPFSWYYFLPKELANYGKSILYLLFFSSNFYFSSKNGYFEGTSEDKPLLHTWSLSIEEQFYLIFPIFFILLYKFFKYKSLYFFLIIFIFSLFITQFGGNIKATYPFVEKDIYFFSQSKIATFFYPLSRIWEILLGVCSAMILNKINNKIFFFNNYLSIFGIILIFYSFFNFDNNTPAPGFYSLLPTIGAVLIIFFANEGTIVNSFLSKKVFIIIGLCSYSAYLIHQPLFVFFDRKIFFEFDILNKFFLIIIVFFYSYLSWKYVEKPFRKKNKISSKNILKISIVVWFSLLIISSFLAFGKNIHNKKLISYEGSKFLQNYQGYKIMTQISKNAYECAIFDGENLKSNIANNCYSNQTNKKSILVWGDSHANSLVPGLKKIFGKKYFIKNVWSASCRLQINQNENIHCDRHNNLVKKIISESENDILVVAQWKFYSIDDLNNIYNFAKENKVKDIIVVGPTPQRTKDLPLIIATNNLFDTKSSSIGIDRYILNEDKKLRKYFKNQNKIIYVSLIDHFCKKDECLIYLPKYPKNDNLLTYDYGHLSYSGSVYVAKNLLSRYIKR